MNNNYETQKNKCFFPDNYVAARILIRSSNSKPCPLLSCTADAAEMFAIKHWDRAVRKSDIPLLATPPLTSFPTPRPEFCFSFSFRLI